MLFSLYEKLDIILKALLINIFLINGWILWRIFFYASLFFSFHSNFTSKLSKQKHFVDFSCDSLQTCELFFKIYF